MFPNTLRVTWGYIRGTAGVRWSLELELEQGFADGTHIGSEGGSREGSPGLHLKAGHLVLNWSPCDTLQEGVNETAKHPRLAHRGGKCLERHMYKSGLLPPQSRGEDYSNATRSVRIRSIRALVNTEVGDSWRKSAYKESDHGDLDKELLGQWCPHHLQTPTAHYILCSARVLAERVS